MNLNPISQNEAAWRNTELGFGGTTIGESGCLLTSFTMVINHGGHDFNPLAINDTLKADGKFVNSCLLPDEAIDGLYGAQFIEKRSYPGPADLSFMADTYEDEYIIEIDASPAPGVQTHFVRWFDGHTNDTIRIYDPWNGTLRHLSDYGVPQTIIQKITHYRVPNPLTPPPPPAPEVVAPLPAPAPAPEPTPEPTPGQGAVSSTFPVEVTPDGAMTATVQVQGTVSPSGNGQPSGDVPVKVVQPSGEVVIAQPDQPEWVTSYVPNDQDLTLETNAIAVDMETGDHKEFPKGTRLALAGSFKNAGVLYFRGRDSAAQGKWFGIPAESFSVLSNTDAGGFLDLPAELATEVRRLNPLGHIVRWLGTRPGIRRLLDKFLNNKGN